MKFLLSLIVLILPLVCFSKALEEEKLELMTQQMLMVQVKFMSGQMKEFIDMELSYIRKNGYRNEHFACWSLNNTADELDDFKAPYQGDKINAKIEALVLKLRNACSKLPSSNSEGNSSASFKYEFVKVEGKANKSVIIGLIRDVKSLFFWHVMPRVNREHKSVSCLVIGHLRKELTSSQQPILKKYYPPVSLAELDKERCSVCGVCENQGP